MALPPRWNWLTGNVQELFEHIWNNARRPNQPQQPLLKFWSEPYQTQYNQYFKSLQFSPTRTAPVHDLDRSILASMTILLLQSSQCVVNGKTSKCGRCFLSGTNQLILSTSPSKYSTPIYQQPIPFFFTISQNCKQTDQALTILASSVSLNDILRQTPSLFAASQDWSSRKSTH